MNLHIDHPVWLVLAGVGLLSAILGWRMMVGIPKGRRALAVVSRAMLLIALSLAMSGVYQFEEADELTVIGVVDVSGSVQSFGSFGTDDLGQRVDIDQAARAFLAGSIGEKADEDRLGIVAFDGTPSVVAAPSRAGVLDRSIDKTPVDGTDLAGAIELARTLVPTSSNTRLVVFSDGRSTRTGLDRIPGDVQIDVVPIRYQIENEVVVESIEVPTRALPGAQVEARVVIRSLGRSSGELRITDNGEPIDLNGSSPGSAMRVNLEPGQRVLMVPMTLGASRVHRFEARYLPDEIGEGTGVFAGDTSLQNNRAGGVTMMRTRGRVLVVSPDGDKPSSEGAELVRVLRDAEWEVEARIPNVFPTDLLELESFDLVVLVNTPLDAMPTHADTLLITYTQELGGGVVFVGGREALGAGGWQGSEIEQILPVKLDIPDDVVVPAVAVVIVLDSSGSMRQTVGGFRTQQEIANESAAAAFEVLDENDLIGVVAFNNGAREIVPMGPNNRPDDTRVRIESISSGGGTNIGAGLRRARDMLAGVEAGSKHIVLLSDGESMNPEELPGLADALSELGIKVSTIAVGDEADTRSMREIAVRSEGAFYRVLNASILPRIFLKAIRIVRAPMIREGNFDPIVLDPVSVATGPLGDLPTLGGLVMTDRIDDDPRVQTPIVSPKGEPVLAYHQTELGRVAVFTSDVSTWSRQWIEDPIFARFWGTLSAWAMRNSDEAPGELAIRMEGTSAIVEYDAIDEQGAPIDGLDIGVQVYDASGNAQELSLTQVGAGRYSVQTPALSPGVHVVIASPTLDGEPLAPTIAGLEVSGSTEYAHLRADPDALIALAQRSGGRIFELGDTAPVDLFSREGLTIRRSLQPVWTTLIAIAFVLFLIDLAMRRVAFDRWVAQAREDTIAAARTIRGEQLQQAFATRQQARASAPETPDIDRSPMMRAKPGKKSEPELKTEESKSDNPLLAAKRRAREQFKNDER